MSLRLRLGLSFALVAITTSLVMVASMPVVIRYGFDPVLPSETASPIVTGAPPAEASPAMSDAPVDGVAAEGSEPAAGTPQVSGSGNEPTPSGRAGNATGQPSGPTPAPTALPIAPSPSTRHSPDRSQAPPTPTRSGQPTKGGQPTSEPGVTGGTGGPSGTDGAPGAGSAGASGSPADNGPGSTTGPAADATPATRSQGTGPGGPGGRDIGTRAPVAVRLAISRSDTAASPRPAADPTASGQPSSDPSTAAWVEVERRTSNILIVVAVLSGVAAIGIGLVLAEAVIRPLRELGRDAAAIAGGDFGRRSRASSRQDEIGELGRSFDTMAAALQQADDSRRRFLQDAAHELGTPVTAIQTTASALLDGVYEPERRHLETIRDEARLLGRIVDDLRTIALAEVGKLPMSIEDVDLAAVTASTADAFAARAAQLRRSIVVDTPGPALTRGDPDRLRQVLSALIDNALRHAPEGGHVGIRSSGSGARVAVEVVDDGPGLGEHPERLFDRFFRADPGPDRTSGHAGLGLAIVRALVEAQGGRVTAANRPGGGASFRVELPVRA